VKLDQGSQPILWLRLELFHLRRWVTTKYIAVFLWKLIVTQLVKKLPLFTELQCSFPFPQNPTISRWPEPAASILHYATLYHIFTRNYLPTVTDPHSPKVCYLEAYQLKFYTHMLAICPAHLIFLYLITVTIKKKSTNYNAPHYVIFSMSLNLSFLFWHATG